ncbi:MAG TPA: 16S rRNA (uracil(1498)-N(3))-methyltransferase [Gammaproteobacteria bacterium]|nr:16S rRNA (uracil(1498)-N(3))-methyltransferase [Gammaproteobacteria bacterium]
MTRIYQPDVLSAHSTLVLNESASHHLARVLRASIGDKITVFNGQGGEYSAIIRRIDKKTVTVDLLAFSPREVESPLDMVLAQGIARGEKMDYLIQKAVELGVNEIIPLLTERCNVKLDVERSEKRLQHWQSVVISACEQSGRNRVPVVHPPQSLEKGLSLIKADHQLVLSPHEGISLKKLAISAPARVILLVGPEGGFSPREMQWAVQSRFIPLNLGPRVLRTETASVAAITALQSVYGDMG